MVRNKYLGEATDNDLLLCFVAYNKNVSNSYFDVRLTAIHQTPPNSIHCFEGFEPVQSGQHCS